MIILAISLVLVSGCSSVQSDKTQPGEYMTATSTKILNSVPINEPVKMENNGYSFEISVNKLKFDPDFPYRHELQVAMTIKNTGTKALSLMCFGTVTDYAGVHATGVGAGTSSDLYPDESQSLIDHLIIPDKQYKALIKDSKLDVLCFGQPQVELLNFRASWDVKPNDLT